MCVGVCDESVCVCARVYVMSCDPGSFQVIRVCAYVCVYVCVG